MNWIDKEKKRRGYKGCKNCVRPRNECDWLKQGGDGHLHIFCPKWEKERGK